MTLSKFDIAVNEASSDRNSRVSNIRREEAGEVAFLLDAPGLGPLRMRLICRDPSIYPERPEFMLFAESDENTECIAEPLERFGRWNTWPSVAEAIRLTASEISRHIKGKGTATGKLGYKFHFQKSGPSSSYRSANNTATAVASTTNAASTALHSDKHFQREILLAQAAGIKANLIQYKYRYELHSVLSLSFPASKLGLTKGELQLGEIGLRDHIVLLIHLGDIGTDGFNSASLLNKHSTVKFRLGRCDEDQPCDESVAAVFGHYEPTPQRAKGHGKNFEPVYASNSINSFLKSELGEAIHLRRIEQTSWAKAQNRISNSPTTLTPTVDNAGPLKRDYAREADQDFAPSLIAMQYALWRLVNCKKFCMVCHKALGLTVSSTGPFLCEDEFCSFQLISSQLGPDLEQQLRSNPYTIDILVCFFFSSVASSVALDLPRDHGIKLVYMGSTTLAPQHYAGTSSLVRNLVHLDIERSDTSQPLSEGDLVVIIPRWNVDWRDTGIHKWHIAGQYIKRIVSLKEKWCKYESFDAAGEPLQGPPVDVGMTAFNTNEPYEEVCIFGFWHDFNNFERLDQEIALLQTLDCLPTVLLMRDFILREPNSRLLSWARMNYSLATLLYWIIASNNSGLVQDDCVPNVKNGEEKVSASTRISGLHHGYMQFRFVRGSLDFGKEFNSALTRFYPQPQRPSDSCTFFACSVNLFEEWSKILRNGLKSTKRRVGIAGDSREAVTFSQRVPMTTELALCQPALIINDVFRPRFWSKSVLQPVKAAAICEIVHCGEEPQIPRYIRYAVENVGLVEPRFLLVKVEPIDQAIELPLGPKWESADDKTGFVAQMSERQLIRFEGTGDGIPLHIPMASLPEAYYRKSIHPGSLQHSDTDSDIESFTEPEYEPEPATKRRQRPVTRVLDRAKRYKSTRNDDSSDNASEDERGIYSPPRIAPIWSVFTSYSLHRLQREEKDLRQIQNKELIDKRGWAIHFEELPNLFQWVVEFPYVMGSKSVFLELHFGPTYPFCPPFVRILKPRLRSKHSSVKTHCLETGCICIELLTTPGWNPALPMSAVLKTLRSYLDEAMASATPRRGRYHMKCAVDALPDLVNDNGWEVPDDYYMIAAEIMR